MLTTNKNNFEETIVRLMDFIGKNDTSKIDTPVAIEFIGEDELYIKMSIADRPKRFYSPTEATRSPKQHYTRDEACQFIEDFLEFRGNQK